MHARLTRSLSALSRFFRPGFDRRIRARSRFGRTGAQDPGAAWLALLRHELKTPLAGLLGIASQFELTGLAPGQRRLLAALTASGRQMAGMIDRLVPQSSTAACRLLLAQDEIDGHRFLEQLLLAHWPEASGRKIGLHLLIDALLPRRWVIDACRLRQILDNLLVNAIHATRTGHVLLRAGPASRPIQGRFAIELAVEDTGGGLDPALRRRLYRWGARGTVGASLRPAGSGIGLFVCRWLSEELGGWIRHDGGPKGGTVFTVGVPVSRELRPLSSCRIRCAAFTGFQCIVALSEPLDTVAASILERIGVCATRVTEPDWTLVPSGFAAVLCDRSRVDALPLRLPPQLERRAPLIVSGAVAGPGLEKSALRASPLSLPLLQSGMEPQLLQVALESRIAAAHDAFRRFSDGPGSAPRSPG